MASKKKGKGKASKGKVSSVKLSNKHLNKLAKRGKLKTNNKEKKLKEQREDVGRRGNEQQYRRQRIPTEEDVDVQEEDISFYGTPGAHSSFVAASHKGGLRAGPSGGKKTGKGVKRKLEDNEDTEEDYERMPRKVTNDKKKMMLPIKTKHGIVQRMIETDDAVNGEMADEGDSGHEEDYSGEEEEEDEPLPVLSGIELYAHRQKKLKERKQKIATLSSSIVENPDENMKKLRELVSMLNETDPDVYVTVRKLTMMSLLEVFKDIIPGYHIRLPTDKEQDQKMKKETKTMMAHEVSLVRSYKDYLEFLDKTAKGSKQEQIKAKKKKRKHENPTEDKIPDKSQFALKLLSIRCLCELLNKHPHFNYTNNIIMVLVPYMNNHNAQISDLACECVRQAFRDDMSGSVTLEITKTIGKMIKAREFRVQPKVLDTFLSLRIKEVSYTDPVTKAEEAEKKQHNDHLSRREKKKKKKEMFLERDLHETKATEDKRRRLKLHTETIQTVFITYFRILKKATDSALLPSVLQGLAKFAHLINVDFFDDLFAVFNKLIAEEVLSYRESLHCVQTAFTILSGQGSVLNIDPVIFYRHLYKNLFHVHAGSTSGDVSTVLDCLDIMVSKRKRQVSQQRILAFLKRLMTLTLQQSSEGCLGLLAVIRSFMITYNYTDILLENEAQGSGVYMPELHDPEHCNAHNTAIWELTLIRNHYDPTVRKYCAHLSHGAPTSGDGQLPPDLRKFPKQLVRTYEKLDFFNQYVPEKPILNKQKKMKSDNFIQTEFYKEVLQSYNAINDTDVT